MKITRSSRLLYKTVLVNGFPGCGKTMLSPIISAFNNVEIIQFPFLIEQVSELWGLKKIEDDVAESLIKMNADLLLYNAMMGRNTNCRPSDISSIFRNNPIKYLVRMFTKGDEKIPALIKKNKPILHLTTHMLLPNSEPLFNALGEDLFFIEVVRHPLYMLIQQEKNFQMFEGVRNQHVRYTVNNREYTFFTEGWEKEFLKCNSFEKSVYTMKWYFDKINSIKYKKCMIIPFEKFVKNPSPYMNEIACNLSSEISKNVKKEMIKQNVPRNILADAPALKIYKRCGWQAPIGDSETDELNVRRELISKNINEKVLSVLDELCDDYIKNYSGELI